MIYYDNRTFKNDQLYEVYILKKFLTNKYGEQKAIKLIKANAANLDNLAKALGESDISFFCLYFLSDIFVVKDSNEARELSKRHYEL